MCLAIPGKIVSIDNNPESPMRQGRVSFGGIIKEVNLSYVPEAKVDEYVIVHAGFALNVLDESEAEEVFRYLKEISGLSDAGVESS